MTDISCWESKFETCIYSDRLLNKLLSINIQAKNKIDLTEVKKAIYYARKYHGSQKRQSGEPYYSHPLEVAYMVAHHSFTTDVLVTSILHDTMEDTELNEQMIACIFGSNIASQVEALTRIKPTRKISAAEIVESLWLQKKDDLLLIKYFDRLHNMQSITIKSPKKQKQIILETLQEFLPLAAYLEVPLSEQELSKMCIYTNLIRQGLSLLKQQWFSFQDDYQPLSLIFQNETAQRYSQPVLEG